MQKPLLVQQPQIISHDYDPLLERKKDRWIEREEMGEGKPDVLQCEPVLRAAVSSV